MDPPDPELGMTLAQAYHAVFDREMNKEMKAFGALIRCGDDERWISVDAFPRQGGVWISRGDFSIGEHGGGWAYSLGDFLGMLDTFTANGLYKVVEEIAPYKDRRIVE